jgi:cyclopropane fatty-acyl-phospholipid synthase-like methyltransferase
MPPRAPSTIAHVNFGTYHHTTPQASARLRENAAQAFSQLMRPLFRPSARLQILDAGCGLGFLMYVAATCFPKARITGLDLFRPGSVSGISLENAAANMKSLGLEARTSFLKHDLTKPLDLPTQCDLVISNLVFHNIGKNRFLAYDTVFDALKPGGHFLIADLFPHEKADNDYFRLRSTPLADLNQGDSARWTYKIKVLQKSQK